MAEESFEEIVASLAMQTVELVRLMHSCHLIHGALSPDTLVMNRYAHTHTHTVQPRMHMSFRTQTSDIQAYYLLTHLASLHTLAVGDKH